MAHTGRVARALADEAHGWRQLPAVLLVLGVEQRQALCGGERAGELSNSSL